MPHMCVCDRYNTKSQNSKSYKNIKREHKKYQPRNSHIQSGISLNKHTCTHSLVFSDWLPWQGELQQITLSSKQRILEQIDVNNHDECKNSCSIYLPASFTIMLLSFNFTK